MLKEHYQKQIDEIMDTYDFDGVIDLMQILKANNIFVRSENEYKNYENKIWLRKEARRLLTDVSIEHGYVSQQSDCLLEARNVDGNLSLCFVLIHSDNYIAKIINP